MRLKELRLGLKLSMKDMAQKLNLPYTTYYGYEKGDREPNIKTIIAIADFFGVSVDSLLGHEYSPSLAETLTKISKQLELCRQYLTYMDVDEYPTWRERDFEDLRNSLESAYFITKNAKEFYVRGDEEWRL